MGFASLEDVARALATRLPAGDGGPSPLGCARLSALLIARSPRATDAVHRTLVARPPWTEEAVEAAQSALAAAAGWPPKPRRRVEEAVWDDLDDSQRQALVRRGADAAQLVDALQKLAGGGVAADSAGALYAPPVELADALAHLRPELGQRASASALVEEAARRLEGVVEPEDPAAALRSAGYVLDGDEWIDPDRVETAVAHGEPKLDPVIPRKRLDDRPELVDGLAAAAETGGVRVVAMPPGRHHRLSRRLHGWLAEALGAERVDYVHVDRALVEALQDSGEWEYVPFYEGKDAPDWSWAAGTCEVALDRAVEAAAPGRVTVLAQPSLLGTLELTSWLSGFYERARGGRHGLVVLAIPGGVHDNRVRLNERYSLPYTPDMAAVYLEA